MPSAFALTDAESPQIVIAYAAPATTVPAVDETPGWHVVGQFFLPTSCEARLDVQGCVSDAALIGNARLYDATANEVVSGSLVSYAGTLVVTRKLSGVVELTGQHNYQIQAECTGDSGDDFFMTIQTATVSD